ncbi:hypothetical protein BH23BAC4_BH23BAC4_14930 [soil metagenome]
MIDTIKRWFADRLQKRLAAGVTLSAACARAQRGAAYLDEVDPGWHTRLDLSTLELADGAGCVLGQLHGDYRFGLGRARVLDFSSAPLASLSPVDLGFQSDLRIEGRLAEQDYAFLTVAWQQEVRNRTRADSRSESVKIAETAGGLTNSGPLRGSAAALRQRVRPTH